MNKKKNARKSVRKSKRKFKVFCNAPKRRFCLIMAQPEFVIVFLTSVYETENHEFVYLLRMSCEDLRKVGWSVDDVISRIEGTVPDDRKPPKPKQINTKQEQDRPEKAQDKPDDMPEEDTRPIPGTDEDGALVDRLDPECFPEPGAGGLSWERIKMRDFSKFTKDHWCTVIHAYMDE